MFNTVVEKNDCGDLLRWAIIFNTTGKTWHPPDHAFRGVGDLSIFYLILSLGASVRQKVTTHEVDTCKSFMIYLGWNHQRFTYSACRLADVSCSRYKIFIFIYIACMYDKLYIVDWWALSYFMQLLAERFCILVSDVSISQGVAIFIT